MISSSPHNPSPSFYRVFTTQYFSTYYACWPLRLGVYVGETFPPCPSILSARIWESTYVSVGRQILCEHSLRLDRLVLERALPTRIGSCCISKIAYAICPMPSGRFYPRLVWQDECLIVDCCVLVLTILGNPKCSRAENCTLDSGKDLDFQLLLQAVVHSI